MAQLLEPVVVRAGKVPARRVDVRRSRLGPARHRGDRLVGVLESLEQLVQPLARAVLAHLDRPVDDFGQRDLLWLGGHPARATRLAQKQNERATPARSPDRAPPDFLEAPGLTCR